MYPQAKRITLVMDNFGTHMIGAFYEAFSPEEAKRLIDRFEFVFYFKTRQLVEYGRDRITCFKRSVSKQTYRNNGRNTKGSFGLAGTS
jgi:hypothetical protein